MRSKLILSVLVLAVACSVYAASSPKKDKAGEAVVTTQDNSEDLRLEGEKRFRANCGRCHAAPHKFPPRMMATIVRHMRVRATITDEDMRLVLLYMTQ
ncbi:MAG: cytochrome c [Acidobacteria bacterium]|nr:cytochrome c [Acidobacteriota bacterium]